MTSDTSLSEHGDGAELFTQEVKVKKQPMVAYIAFFVQLAIVLGVLS